MSKNVNVLQQLKSYINPEQSSFTGEIVEKINLKEYKVKPLGSVGGYIICTGTLEFQLGDRVFCQGTEIIKKSEITGNLVFIEV